MLIAAAPLDGTNRGREERQQLEEGRNDEGETATEEVLGLVLVLYREG